MVEKLKQELFNLQVTGYSDDKLTDFFTRNTYYSIFKTMTTNTNVDLEERFIRFVNVVLEKPAFFEKFMFDQSPEQKKLLAWLVDHDEEQYRAILPRALLHNTSIVAKFLSSCLKDQFEEYIAAIFTLLADQSSEVGLSTLKALSKVAKASKEFEYKFLREEFFLIKLKEGLQSDDGNSVMRHIDLLIDISNLSEELFEIYKSKGLMERILKAYSTDDVLLKLVIVEALPRMGDSAWNAKYVTDSIVSKGIIKDCFAPDIELYVRKNLSVLVAKLIVRDLLPLDVKLKQNFVDHLKSTILSWSNEEVEGALELLSVFLLRQFGVDMMFAHKELTLGLFQNSVSTNEIRKKKFFNAFANIFDQELETKKSDPLRRAFVLFGDTQDIIEGKLTLNELSSTYEKSFEVLFKVLLNAFAEWEQEGVNVLKKLVLTDWFPLEFAKFSKSISYLNENPAKTKEIFDDKNEIRRQLIKKFEKSEDLFLISYREKLIEGIKSQATGKPLEMSYETNVL